MYKVTINGSETLSIEPFSVVGDRLVSGSTTIYLFGGTFEQEWVGDGPAPVAFDPGKRPAVNLQPTPPEFMANAFTFRERVAIREAKKTDPVVADFMELVGDSRLTYVDLTKPGTRDAIGYLATTTPPLLTTERAAQILAGLPAPSTVEAADAAV